MRTTTLAPQFVGACPGCTGDGYELTEDNLLPQHRVAGWQPNRPICTGSGQVAVDIRCDRFYREGLLFLS
jgi:hypothetical protein